MLSEGRETVNQRTIFILRININLFVTCLWKLSSYAWAHLMAASGLGSTGSLCAQCLMFSGLRACCCPHWPGRRPVLRIPLIMPAVPTFSWGRAERSQVCSLWEGLGWAWPFQQGSMVPDLWFQKRSFYQMACWWRHGRPQTRTCWWCTQDAISTSWRYKAEGLGTATGQKGCQPGGMARGGAAQPGEVLP